MTSEKRLVLRVQKLLGIFSAHSVSTEISSRGVYRVSPASGVQDPWERRIIALCDGRSVGSLIATLYSEELSLGGWIADIGLWKNLFEHQVVHTINKLVTQGYVYFGTDETPSVRSGDED